MPLYEFRCRTCDTTFDAAPPDERGERLRPTCPDGHDGAVRLLSVFATAGASAGGSPSLPAGATVRRWLLRRWLRLRALTLRPGRTT